MILYWLIFCGIIDRLSKYWAVHHLSYAPLKINSVISFELAFNRGVSWSFLHAENTTIFIAVSFLVTSVLILLAYNTFLAYQEGLSIKGELFVLIGGISNLFDRLCYAGVVDFISFSYQQWSFPIFNGADCMIVGGVMLLVWYRIKTKRFSYLSTQELL